MSTLPATRPARHSLRRMLRTSVRRLLGRDGDTPRLTFEDLSYAAGRTVQLDELLRRIPDQICTAFRLREFRIFLRQGNSYVLQRPGADPVMTLRSSSAVVAQLKRERRLLPLVKDPPDAWTFLVDPQELAQMRGLGAQALLPLPGRTGLVGFAALAAGKSPFQSHAAQLQKLAAQIGPGLETALVQRSLQDEAARRERITQSLELAREVQERLLPQHLPDDPTLDVAATYQSAEQVGGDYYDAFRTPSGKLCYVIADISGKGPSAALLMATLRSTIRTAMLAEPPLPELLRIVNGQLYEASSSSRYATLAILLYDPATRGMTSSNAGHNPPLLLQSGEVRELVCGGPVLGLLPVVAHEQERFILTPGDRIALYTDGVTEWPNEAGEEWGPERLVVALRSAPPASAAATARYTLAQLSSFAAGAPQPDDTTLLLLISK